MSEEPGRTSDEPVDPDLARLYREASREAPPPHLDAQILAAAHREAGSRPRAIGDGAGEDAYSPVAKHRSWRVPLALAAVIVLSVSILTLSPEIRDVAPPERAETARAPQPEATTSPGSETPERAATPPQEFRRVPGAPPGVASRDEPVAREAPAAVAALRDEAAPEAPPASMAAARPERAPPRPEAGVRLEPRAQQAAPLRAEADLAGALTRQYADQPPEKWGEKIVELRREGRVEEAEALLAEFRRRFPDYRIPAEWTR